MSDTNVYSFIMSFVKTDNYKIDYRNQYSDDELCR